MKLIILFRAVCIVLVCVTGFAQSNPAANETPLTPAPSNAAPSVPPDSTKLKVAKSVKPVYPMMATEKQIQGEVMLKVSVDESGSVEHAEVVSGDPILASAALDALKKWKFEPFIKNGKPIKVVTNLPFDFAFGGNVKDVTDRQATTVDLSKANGQSSSTAGDGGEAPKRIRVGQGVSQGMLVHKVQPVYPPDARRARIQGTVLLQALIGKDGHVKNLHLIAGDKTLAEAAIGAVQQWRYRPYLLMGEPVEVETQITVNFTLSER